MPELQVAVRKGLPDIEDLKIELDSLPKPAEIERKRERFIQEIMDRYVRAGISKEDCNHPSELLLRVHDLEELQCKYCGKLLNYNEVHGS